MEASKVLVIGNENFLALLKNTANYQYVLSKTYNDAFSKLRNTQFDIVVILLFANAKWSFEFCEEFKCASPYGV